MPFPTEIRDLILKTFSSDQQKAYGQISTVSSQFVPSVRTVHIHALEDEQVLAISCNIKSNKVKDIRKNPAIAGCFWDLENQIQFRFEGEARLILENDAKYADLIQVMWMKMREEVRLSYLLDEKGMDLHTASPDIDPQIHSKNHGVMLIQTSVWDVFYNHPTEYRLGTRTIYSEKNGVWGKRPVNSLYS